MWVHMIICGLHLTEQHIFSYIPGEMGLFYALQRIKLYIFCIRFYTNRRKMEIMDMNISTMHIGNHISMIIAMRIVILPNIDHPQEDHKAYIEYNI